MIKCTANDREYILDYIGKEYGKCLYMYVDLQKYGFENENINVWMQKKGNEIKAVVLQYYTGMHIFSRDGEFDKEDIVALINEMSPSMICGMEKTITKINNMVDGYELETGYVGQLTKLKEFDTDESVKATDEEVKEVAKLLSTDEALGAPYGFDLLYSQLKERQEEKFGRSYIYRKNGEIIATASTYAEYAGVAVISGVMVRDDHRGEGLSKNVLSAICKELKKEGFDVFSYYYIPSAIKMHESVGFETLGQWAKLVAEN